LTIYSINTRNLASTKYIDENYLAAHVTIKDFYMKQLIYLANVSTCCHSGIENVVDPHAYAAKLHMVESSTPTFQQAIQGKFVEEDVKAIQLEIFT
jgi:hypothetical protein